MIDSMEATSTALQKCIMYKLKEKRLLSLSNEENILWKHYTPLKYTNEKVICSPDLYSKMNNEQKS